MNRDIDAELRKIECDEGSWLTETETGRAFMSALPDCMLEPVQYLPGEILGMDENDLREHGKCGINEYALRVAFWQEYERTLNSSGSNKMSITRMLKGLIPPNTFRKIIMNPYKLAWILNPVRDYLSDLEFMLVRGKERLWEVMNLPMYDKKGNPNARVAMVVMQAHKMIEDRVLGQTVQKQQQVRVSVRSTADANVIKEIADVNVLDDKIKQLEAEIRSGGTPVGNVSSAYGNALPSKEGDQRDMEVLLTEQDIKVEKK